jgi:alpha-beta hydrolase superfamily lysophospholipase
MTPITIPVSTDGTLQGDYVAGTTNPAFVVLWVHGFGSHRGGEKAVAVREECVRRGWSFAAFDFRGHGTSSGTMHELRASRLLEDLTAIRSWLKDTCKHTQIGIVASSMGGFASAWSVVRNPDQVIGCVFIAPAFEFLERRWAHLTESQRVEWKRTDRLRVKTEWVETELGFGITEELDQFPYTDLTRAWKTPALIVHGAADNVIPDSESLLFLHQTAYSDVELHLLKAGDHRLTAFKEEIAEKVVRFFNRWIRS